MDQLTESTLKEWGFEQYVVRFKEAEIDFKALLTLTENMVAELIPIIGHRSKFVNSLKLLNEKHNKETSSKDIPDENTSENDKFSTSENIQQKQCTSEPKPVLARNQDKMPQKQSEVNPLQFILDNPKTMKRGTHDSCAGIPVNVVAMLCELSDTAVKSELSDDSHNVATTSSTADHNFSISFSNNSSSQSKRQRISSNSSSSKHEDENNVSIAGTPTTTPTQTIAQPQQAHQKIQQDNTKEKCRKFLAKLLELSSKEPKPVERSVRTFIQELVDAKVEPEQFCDRLEKLLNASPQPCLIGFLKKNIEPLRRSLMLNEMKIDGIRPPPSCTPVQESINIPIESCNNNPAETTRVVGSTEADNILQRSMDMGGKNDVAVNEKKSDQHRKRPSIPVSIELSDDSHNVATTSSTADRNSSMTLSDNSSSQSKRQRISSSSSSFKHEYYDGSLDCTTPPVSSDSTSYRRTDDDEEDDENNQLSNTTQASISETLKLGQWKPYYCRFTTENIVLETKIEPNILEWTADAAESASSIDSKNVAFREHLQKSYEKTIQKIPNHSTFCMDQKLNEPSYGTNKQTRIAAPTGMVYLYKALHELENKHNCKFTFLPSSIGRCLIEYTKNADLDLDPVHSVSNNILDVLRYPLRNGLIPEKYWLDFELFLSSVYLKNNYLESTRRVQTKTVVRFNFIEGEIEALVFDYWSRSTIDLIYYNESKSRRDLKRLLQYLFQRLCIQYIRIRTREEVVGLFLTNFKELAEFDLDKDIIPKNCLLFLKNNISKVWPYIKNNDRNLWCAFFTEMKVNYILTARTFSAMFKKLDQNFEFIMSKAAQVRAIRSNPLSDVSLWYASTTVSEERQTIVNKSDVISILPEFFKSPDDIDSVLCTAIDNFYYHHIFLLSRYAILHNVDISTRVLKHTEVQKFLDNRQPPKIGSMSYVKLPLSESMQSKMVSCFRRLYIRDSDKFDVEFEITEFEELLYQSLNELICNCMKKALCPIIGHDGKFSKERYESLYPCDGHDSLPPNYLHNYLFANSLYARMFGLNERVLDPQDYLRCHAFANSLYAHMYGLNKRESVSMRCFELDCNFKRDVSVYYDKIIAESDNV